MATKPLKNQELADFEADLARKGFSIQCEVQAERFRQNRKFTPTSVGVQAHNIMTWALILAEECGEVAQASLQTIFGGKTMKDVREELIQVMAVSQAILERIDEDDVALIANEGTYEHTDRPYTRT